MKKFLIIFMIIFAILMFFSCDINPDSGDSGDSGDAGDGGNGGNDPIPGPFTEDFETGDLSKFYWVTGGDYPPSVIQGDNATHFAHNGSGGDQLDGYALEMNINMTSGAGLNKDSWFAAQFDVTTETTLSFYFKTSLDSGDYFGVYVDGEEAFTGQAVSWTEQVITLPVGNYNVTWYYIELVDNVNGFAKVWIDDISVGEGASMIDPIGKMETRVNDEEPDSNGNHEITINSGNSITVTVAIGNSGIAPINLTGNPVIELTSGGSAITVNQPTTTTVQPIKHIDFTLNVNSTGETQLIAELSIANNTAENPYTFTITMNIVNEILIDDFSAYTLYQVPGGNWTVGEGGDISSVEGGPTIALPSFSDPDDPQLYCLQFDTFVLEANGGYRWASIPFTAPSDGTITFDYRHAIGGSVLDEFKFYIDIDDVANPTTAATWTSPSDIGYTFVSAGSFPITAGSHVLTWRWVKAAGETNDFTIDIDNIYFSGN
jgi:hypothetical protein